MILQFLFRCMFNHLVQDFVTACDAYSCDFGLIHILNTPSMTFLPVSLPSNSSNNQLNADLPYI